MILRVLRVAIILCILPSFAHAVYVCGDVHMNDTSMIPEKYKDADYPYRFFRANLCPPASQQGQRFFLIWRGGECDSRVNIGFGLEWHNDVQYIWFDNAMGGSPGYFNLIGTDSELMLWGLTLIDYHAKYYHSLVFSEQNGTFKLYSRQKTPIPLPPTVVFPE